MQQRRPGAIPDAAVVERRRDLAAHRRGVEHLDVVAVCAQERRSVVELVGGRRVQHDADVARPLEVAGDPEPRDVGDQALEVLEPEPLERVQLVREARRAVLEPVGQRGDREAAVAAARAEAAGLALEDDDLAIRVVRPGLQRRPEAGEAAADDAEIGVDAADQAGRGLGWGEVGEPERARLGVGVGGALRGGRWRRRPDGGHWSSATRRTISRQSGPTASSSSVYWDGLKQIEV